jgi:hypothetical protein
MKNGRLATTFSMFMLICSVMVVNTIPNPEIAQPAFSVSWSRAIMESR